MTRAFVELVGVHKAFGDKPVLRGMDLAIGKGEILYIVGTSGVGKTATIKHLVGFLPIDTGEIWFDGKLIRKHACIDGPEIDAHLIDWDKFLPRFNQFRPQEQDSRVRHGLA